MSGSQHDSSRPGLGMGLRVTAAVALLGVWVGLTSTTRADPADARPGTALSVTATESLDEDSSARQLYRLLAATEATENAKDLRAALTQARDLLGLEIPEADAEADSVHDAHDIPTEFATSALDVSEALAKSGLKAPQDQAARLFVSAALIDDAARDTLEASGKHAPKGSGVDAVLGYDERPALTSVVGDLATALPSGLKGTSCDTTPDDTGRLAPARSGFADAPVTGARAAESRGLAFHAVGVEAGKLAYATRVVGQRQNSTVFLERADDLDGFVDGLQDLMPSGCAPVATTSVGATEALTDPTTTLSESQAALADRTRIAAAAMPVGESRLGLAKLWWRLR
ncbi:MAG: hypothetical protein ACTIJJ_11310 [Galactobacter sp.]